MQHIDINLANSIYDVLVFNADALDGFERQKFVQAITAEFHVRSMHRGVFQYRIKGTTSESDALLECSSQDLYLLPLHLSQSRLLKKNKTNQLLATIIGNNKNQETPKTKNTKASPPKKPKPCNCGKSTKK